MSVRVSGRVIFCHSNTCRELSAHLNWRTNSSKWFCTKRTVKEGIDRWLEVQRALKASSTVVNYVSKAVHVEKKFGKRRIVDISKSDIELFQAQLLKQGLAPKTVNDIFTVVRGVWADAFGDVILKANPLDRISNVGSDVDLEHADPFVAPRSSSSATQTLIGELTPG